MAESDEYVRGFSAGWIAASQAMAQGMERAMKTGADNPGPAPARLATSGDKPARRGRPPKAASAGDQPKRPRGRPRKTETT
jgi:hypothetical protein